MRHLIVFRHLTIANHLLPAIVNDDYSGLEDSDIDQLNAFLTDLEAEIATFSEELTADKHFFDLVLGDMREDDFRWCAVTDLAALCSPVKVLVATYGGAAPNAGLYKYTSFLN